jgi:formate hydrogenlyase subunit 3/multisubunit Na+/H+ antiporter MnhD subunit
MVMETFSPAPGMPVAFAIRISTIVLTLAVTTRPRLARHVAFWGSVAGSMVVLLTSAAILSGSAAPAGIVWAHAASGFEFSYRVDGLSAWFLFVLAALAIPVAVYSVGYAAHGFLARRSAFLGVGFNLLHLAVEGVFVADNVIAFIFAWELMTLATAALVATEHEARTNRRAAYLYLVMSHVGTGCLIAAFLLLAGCGSAAASPDQGPLGVRTPGSLRDLFLLGTQRGGKEAIVEDFHDR